MNRIKILNEIINTINEVIKVKKNKDITDHDLESAIKMINSMASNQEEIIDILRDLLEHIDRFNYNVDYQNKIITCIIKIYKDLITFDEECLRILSMRR